MMKTMGTGGSAACVLGLCASLLLTSSALFGGDFSFEQEGKNIRLRDGASPVWEYVSDRVEQNGAAPDDPLRLAGCYLHPLWGVSGEILTANAPSDHRHHHGVFWTWPHVIVEQPDGTTAEYNLWAGNTPICQRPLCFGQRSVEGETAVFSIENGWFLGEENRGTAPPVGKPILRETVEIKTGPIQERFGKKTRRIDLTLTLTPTDSTITLRGAEGKSYGGFTVRCATDTPRRETEFSEIGEINDALFCPDAEVHSEDTDFITLPRGVARCDLPMYPLSWADFTTRFGDDRHLAGVTLFVWPDHPDFPPTWMVRYYGAICVGWPGVEGKSIAPDSTLRLRYTLLIHEGRPTSAELADAYRTLTAE